MSARTSERSLWIRVVRVGVTLVAILVLLAGAGVASWWIKQSEPVAEREASTRRSAALVETIVVETGTYRPTISALGSVRAARDIVLSPRVSGQILSVEPAFTLGGLVEQGELLVRLDAADYEQALVTRQSEMLQVQAELAIEEGQQRVARREFELLGTEVDEANRSLVLRVPQIESLRAKLKAAEAAVEQARLDLSRVEVRAPFDGQILSRSAELGSQVSAGAELARLVGTEEAWVVVTVPLAKLRWIEFPGDGHGGARATVRHSTAWRPDEFRKATVERLIGEVDRTTRMGRVIVQVPDPLGGDGAPSLILGSIVQVEIEAIALDDVIRLDRAYLRQNDTVWVLQDDELRIQPVEVLFSDATHAYIGDGLEPGSRVVTTSLATVVDGLAIRDLEDAGSTAPAEGDQ